MKLKIKFALIIIILQIHESFTIHEYKKLNDQSLDYVKNENGFFLVYFQEKGYMLLIYDGFRIFRIHFKFHT